MGLVTWWGREVGTSRVTSGHWKAWNALTGRWGVWSSHINTIHFKHWKNKNFILFKSWSSALCHTFNKQKTLDSLSFHT